MMNHSLGDLLREAVPEGGSELLPSQVLRSARRRQTRRRLAGVSLAVMAAVLAVPTIILQGGPDVTPDRLAVLPRVTPTADGRQSTIEVFPPTAGASSLGTVLLPPAVADSLNNLNTDNRVADLLATTTVDGESLYLVGAVRDGLECTVQFANGTDFVVGPGLCERADRTWPEPGDFFLSSGPDWISNAAASLIVNGIAPAGTRYVRIETITGVTLEVPVASAGARWRDKVFFIAQVPGEVTTLTALNVDREEVASAHWSATE